MVRSEVIRLFLRNRWQQDFSALPEPDENGNYGDHTHQQLPKQQVTVARVAAAAATMRKLGEQHMHQEEQDRRYTGSRRLDTK